MEITPPDVPQAALVPNINATWKVESTNQLAVFAYSDEDYSRLNAIAVIGSVMVWSYLTMTVATLLFRKFIGL